MNVYNILEFSEPLHRCSVKFVCVRAFIVNYLPNSSTTIVNLKGLSIFRIEMTGDPFKQSNKLEIEIDHYDFGQLLDEVNSDISNFKAGYGQFSIELNLQWYQSRFLGPII